MKFAVLILAAGCALAADRAGRYEIFEASFEGRSGYANPYLDVEAEATVTRPDGAVWRAPLFWDGGSVWKLRLSPDAIGAWNFRIASNDARLNGRRGSFVCSESNRTGGIRASNRWPSHFERQNGAPFWFLGDTAWAYFLDVESEKYNRAKADEYVRARASQGFNVIHSMMLSEEGDGNSGGPPFRDLTKQLLNPTYWQEVDSRLAFANSQGLTVGLAIAWGDKRKVEPLAWRRFPSLEARKRYARYMGARYGAYDVYFLVSGEWHGEVRTRGDVTEEAMFREFVEIGDALAAAEPHGRMKGIHPMTGHGSVREFASASWMSFGDYQQNYNDLHARIVLSRQLRGPVVNSEYGYHLRDQNGDGVPDKSNSYTLEDMRFASWDIVMGGGYLVTGFGTTYFGGHRDPGPFDVKAAKNRDWERQIGYIAKLFTGLEWWKLTPADAAVASETARTADRRDGRDGRDLHPPATVYWALANPGETYLAYVRGTTSTVTIELGARPRKYRVRQFDPRTGSFQALPETEVKGKYTYQPPDAQDWVVLLEGVD